MDSDTHVPKEGYVRLQDIAEKIRNGEKVEPVAVRELQSNGESPAESARIR
ncbi:MAG TPA: hypothetical protein VGR91_04990 [Stellaceae bacterium]|nr:hypothetical protein [Stellaceae bacterium]